MSEPGFTGFAGFSRWLKAILIVILIGVQASFAQQKVAILNTEDDGEPPIKHNELGVLTAKLRDIANKTLPKPSYEIMTEQSILSFLGSQKEMEKICNEAEGCLARIGRDIEADYIGQARISRFGMFFAVKVEIYDSKKGTLVGSFTDDASKDIYALSATIDKKAPDMFMKIQGVSKSKFISPMIPGGISGLESGGGYEFNQEKRYLLNFNTEPLGATPSFDGLPIASCSKTPCKAELPEGNIRIIAALEQYETADTTISVMYNNQNVTIKLKPNFGVFEINPAYPNGIGKYEPWNLAMNDKSYSLGEIRLVPGQYSVKISHRCYEDISFKVGINKGEREVFNLDRNANLKKSGFTLSAERDGQPAVEPVYINGKREGETPFSGSVPLCANIEIGESREKINIELKHNETIRYTVKLKGSIIPTHQATAEESYNIPKEDEKFFSLGFGFGLNYSHLYAKYNNGSKTIEDAYESTVGSQFVLAFDFALSKTFHLQPGIMYIIKGAEDSRFERENALDLHYIEFPVLLSLKFSIFRFNAGPYYGICMKTKQSLEIKSVNYSPVGFDGNDFGISAGLGIYNIYIFYDYGLKNFNRGGPIEHYNRTLGFNFGVNL